MLEIEKIDIAIEQTNDSLSAYFNGHYHSAIVLAGASEQLLAGYVMKHEAIPARKSECSSLMKISNGLKKMTGGPNSPTAEQKIGKNMNHVYNNLKHAGKTNHTLYFDPKLEARRVIERAILNFDILFMRPEYDLSELSLYRKFIQESSGEARFE